MQPLSVQAAELNFKENLIPPSRGLLATTDNSHKTSALPPANDHPQSEPAAQVWGMRILNLPPSPTTLRASHCPPAEIVHTETHSGLKWTEDKKTRYSIPKRQLSLISLSGPTQPRIEKSERMREEFPLLPPVTTAHTPVPMQGLRLLRYTSAPQGKVTFPKIAPAPSSRPCQLMAAPIKEAPMLKLLHIESGTSMARNALLPFQMSHRESLQRYLCSVICHRCRQWCLLQPQWHHSCSWRKRWRHRLAGNRMLKRRKSSCVPHLAPRLPCCQALSPARGNLMFFFILFILL